MPDQIYGVSLNGVEKQSYSFDNLGRLTNKVVNVSENQRVTQGTVPCVTTTGAVSHRVSTGSWSGAGTAALNGMGDGALSGAIIGAISGGASAGLRYGTFSSKSSLTQHFAKHGDEFGDMYTNAKEYAQGAKYVIKNGTYIPEKNAYIRFLGTQGKANYAFVGMKAGGRISTYHVRSVSKMIRDGISIFY